MNTSKIECTLVLKHSDFIMQNHHVHGVSLMPGATFLDIVFRMIAAQGMDLKRAQLREILFPQAIATREGHDRIIRMTMEPGIDGVWEVQGASRFAHDPEQAEWRENFRAQLHFAEPATSQPINVAALIGAASRIRDNEEVYRIARSEDIVHGAPMKCFGRMYQGEGYLLAELRLDDASRDSDSQFHVHPAKLDASTLLAFAMTEFDPGQPFIPVYIHGFRAPKPAQGLCYVYIPAAEVLAPSQDVISNSYFLIDEHGEVLAHFDKLTCKCIRNAGLIQRLVAEQVDPYMAPPVEQVAQRSDGETPQAPIKLLLTQWVAEALGVEPRGIDPDRGFYDLGLESVQMLALSERLQGVVNAALYPTLLFEFGSISVLAQHLQEAYGAETGSQHLVAVPQRIPAQPGLRDFLKGCIAQRLGIGPEQVAAAVGFYALGLESVDMLELSTQLGEYLAQPLYPTLLFEYSDVDSLCAYLEDRFDITACSPGAVTSAVTREPVGTQGDVQLSYYQPVWQIAERLVLQESLPSLTLVEVQDDLAQSFARCYAANPERLSTARLVDEHPERQAVCRVVQVSLSQPGEQVLLDVWQLLKTLFEHKLQVRLCLLLVGSHAHESSVFRALTAFVRTVSLEFPGLWCRVVAQAYVDAQTLISEFDDTQPEPAVWHSGHGRQLLRFTERDFTAPADGTQTLRKQGKYLIAGGNGGVGRQLAEYLARSLQASVMLLGRRPVDSAAVAAWQQQGMDIHYLQADLGVAHAVEAAVARTREQFGALHGVLHCAGVLRDALFFRKQQDDIEAVLVPKLAGLRNLDQATCTDDLDFFVMFSSVSASVANIGQSAYAYANAYMESYACARAQRQDRPGRSLAIGWPYWRDGGMAVSERVIEQGKQSHGLHPMPTDAAVATLQALLAGAEGSVVVAYGETSLFQSRLAMADHESPAQPAPALDEADGIAIVGVAGRYPGADTLEAFWSNLVQGKDCVSEVPAQRWQHADIYHPQRGQPGKTYGNKGGFIDRMTHFDAPFFGISRREAELMDPQERQFLTVCWQALEDAGYTPQALDGDRVGVFAGVMWNHYQSVRSPHEPAIATALHASVANRVSYCLNMRGPSLAVDTMCSSSLTALHLAAQSLRNGDCDLALAGGVNLMPHPDKYLQLAEHRFLSDDGLCRSFGEGGSGYVPGEGVGAVLLKPLKRARADGDTIHAVIRGSALNHSGKTSGYTVPSPVAQASLLAQAMRQAGVDARRLSYIEAHGTGTALGDPIEVDGVRQAFQSLQLPPESIAIGSVKSNIGHLESAAGIAAVTKVLLQMRHAQLVPSLHAEALNPHIDFARSPVRVQRELSAWPAPAEGIGRVAGVSAFGAGGSNVHVVLEEYPCVAGASDWHEPNLFVLSARSDDVLRRYAQRFVQWLRERGTAVAAQSRAGVVARVAELLDVAMDEVDEHATFGDMGLDLLALDRLASEWQASSSLSLESRIVDLADGMSGAQQSLPALADLAFTLQYGRLPMARRLAIVVSSAAQLGEALTAFIEGAKAYPGAFWNGAGETQTNTEAGHVGQLWAMAQDWQGGAHVDWSVCHGKARAPRRVSLPVYPFEEEHVWLGGWKGMQGDAHGAPLNTLALAPPSQGLTAAPAMPGEWHGQVRGFLDRCLSKVLYLNPGELDPALSFSDAGLESTGVLEVIDSLNQAYGLTLEVSAIYDHPSIDALTLFVEAQLLASGKQLPAPEPSSPVQPPVVAPVNAQALPSPAAGITRGVAIIGMSGRFPDASDLEQFWANLATGHCSAREADIQRWSAESFDANGRQPGKARTRSAALLDDVDRFDAGVFNISPLAAQLMDPQQRLFLEQAWAALEDAGYAGDAAQQTTCGVYVGCAVGDYIEWIEAAGQANTGEAFLGVVPSILAARISYRLNLSGPAMAVDTACSSSLVAIHLACESIRSGECDMALAGGVALMLTPQLQVRSDKMGILSPTGRCAPFDAQANGTVLGEGVGVVVLKDLQQALRDGDNVLGVVYGSGSNSDGKSNGITAPSADAQEALIRQVHARAGVTPSDIGYLEAHGTGTLLGDPIEVNALKRVFGPLGVQGKHCALGSVKSNIGHTTMAAGVASLIKLLLGLRHRQQPPTLHFSNLNDKIDLVDSPLFVGTELREWLPGPDGRRLAGVSSFGFSGTNCHLVVGDVAPAVRLETPQVPAYPVVLSGRTAIALRQRIQALLAWLQSAGKQTELADLAFTLACGRSHFAYRQVWVVSSLAQLHDCLEQALIDDVPAHAMGTSASFPAHICSELLDAWVQAVDSATCLQALEHVSQAYVAGATFDWAGWPQAQRHRRISLPTYPFARDRHWLERPAAIAAQREPEAPYVNQTENVNMLLGMPTLAERNNDSQVFTFTLPAAAWLLADHVVNGQPVLPGVASLEMAVSAALGGSVQSPVRLGRVRWLRPVLGTSDRALVLRVSTTGGHKHFALESVEDGPMSPFVTGQILPAQADETQQVLDLAGLAGRTGQRLSQDQFYQAFADAGIDYGAHFRVIESVGFNDQEALGRIVVSDFGDLQPYHLPPSVLDGAFQVIAALQRASGDGPAVPFALDSLEFVQPIRSERCYSYVKRTGAHQFSVQVADAEGQVCVRCQGFSLRPSRDALAGMSFVPRWRDAPMPDVTDTALSRVLILHAPQAVELAQALQRRHAGAQVVLGALGDFPASEQPFDALYFLAGAHDPSQPVAQDPTLKSAFSLLKKLIESHHRRHALSLKFVVHGVVATRHDEAVQPYGAGLLGMARAAASEYPNWRVDCIDAGPWHAPSVDELAAKVVAERSTRGVTALRANQRLQRVFEPVRLAPAGEGRALLEQGTYLVIGGAGGLGFEVSCHLARSKHARLAWVGRRAEDDSIRDKLRQIEALGGRACYFQADLCDEAAMRRALEQTAQRLGTLRGVLHIGGVFRDMSLARMDEAAFDAVLAPKVAGMAVLERVLQGISLDFLLLFSTAASFVEAAGQANYAAASTFEDAYALNLRARSTYPVCVINWGYWGSVGAVSGEAHRTRMAAIGLESIEIAEAAQALERVLTQNLAQTLVIKAKAQCLSDWFGIQQQPQQASMVETLEASRLGYQRLESLSQALLAESLQASGWMPAPGQRVAREVLAQRAEVQPGFIRLFDAMLDIAVRSGAWRFDADAVVGIGLPTPAAPARELLLREHADMNAHVQLLQTCVDSLREIVSGRRNPVEVLFPKGSMALVQQIYKGQVIANFYNDLLTKAVVARAKHVIEAQGRAVRILEIGAGTGGTTSGLLPALAGLQVEYCYTDVSSAFLLHGKQHYAPDYPYLSFELLDIGKAPEQQGFVQGHYDIVLATMVLHVAADLTQGMRNVAWLLGQDGEVFINEVTRRHDFLTLTFGTLSGWWAYKDEAQRLPHAPMSSTRQWRDVLERADFASVRIDGLAGVAEDDLDQALIMAKASGRQHAARLSSASATVRDDVARGIVEVATQAEQGGAGDMLAYLKGVFAETLKYQVHTLDEQATFESFGVDSLIGQNITARLEQDFGNLPATLLFEYMTLASLAEYLQKAYPQAAGRQGSGMTHVIPSEPAVTQSTQDVTALPSVLGYLKRVFAEVLKYAPAELDERATFESFGVDSLNGQKLIAQLEQDLGELPATLLFEYLTLEQLGQYLIDNLPQALASLLGGTVASRPPVSPPASVSAVPVQAASPGASQDASDPASDIAIIGVSGRYPGSPSVEQLWDNLAAGVDCVSEVPAGREDWQRYLRQGFSAGPAGYLDQVDQFDPAVFSILPRDAVNMDPQERLFLETCWRLLESAGYLDEYRKEPSTGVFVGSMYGAYGQLAATRWNDGQLSGGHSAHWSLANRVSYCFDLQGPSFAVDSACSSSLTAVHLACESLLRNECRVAIAGGVNVILHPAHFASLDALNMLSSHGRSMVFDARADGFAPGEGVGAVLLKPLSAAEADGDEILAVIKGSLVNAGGKTGGYTVPNPNAQAQLIEQVLLRSGVQPQTISYVELHGTGTALGDPIEVGSLAKAFRSAAEHDAPAGAAIGSIKANIGHLEGAAGIAGLSKLLMQFKHRQLAPCVHLQTLNPKIDFERSPLHPQRQLQAWQRPVLDLGDGLREYPLRAGLSSFGAGGANAHLILEEYEDRRPGHALPGTEQPVLFLLSAKTRAQLAVWATDSANFIASAKGAACTLAELGYTSQTGRREMNERLAIVAQDHATLEQALRAFASGDDTHPGVFHDGGRDAHLKEMLADEDGASFISMLLQHRNLPKLGRVWVQGVRIDWRAMWRDGMPKRVALPGYPFEHKRYWIDLDQQPVNTVPALREQIVEQRLDAQAYYCQEHRIRGQRWLPGMFYLELVRQATGLLAAPLRFSDVQWLAPLNLENGVPRLSVHLKVAGGSTVFQVVADGTTTHCQGVLASDCPAQPAPVDLQVLASRCTQVVSAEAVYASLHDAGLEHGASFQVLRQVSLGTAQALADLVSTQGQDAGLPTALLDGALQSLAVLDREPGSNSYVPVGFDSFIVYRALPSRVLVWAREEGQAETGSGIRCFALTLLASDGQVLAELGGLRVAPMLGLRAFVGRDESVPEVVATPTHTSRLAEVEVALQQMAARFLMIDEAAVDLAAELLDSGFDSVSLTELLAEVNQHFALDLLPQVLFDCPTLASFARFVVSSLAPLTPPPDGGAKRTTPTPSRSDQTAPVTTVQAGTHESVVAIRSELQRIAAGFLMVEQGAVDLSAELLDSGFDSVSLTELLVEVNQRFALDLMPQILFDLPTLDALAGYLQPLLQDVAVVVPALKPAPLATQPSFAAEPAGSPLSMQQSLAREEDPIAIIGIAARLPQSEDLQAFWAHLMAGDDLVTEVPADRPVLKADPVMRGMKAGFIDDVAAFDARFFKIAPSEAASMDPQQRLFLETAWRAIEDAGYPPSSLAGSATGVFVGVGTTDYNDLMTAQGMSMDGHTATGIAHSIMANRVSYLLDLQGPSEVIDTACSSALVALHRAVQAIGNGECEKALAGGVNLTLAPGLFEAFTQSGMLSGDARCKTFDASADGYVRGEGAGAVLLAPLSVALAEGAPVYALIRGSAVRHGGRTNSLTAPSASAQSKTLIQAYRRAGVDPATLGYVEAHGTGTRLGDPIEVEGLKVAFAELAQDHRGQPYVPGRIGIGSVKTQIGHLEAAAGIAGVLKVLLAMKHGQLPGNLHFRQENPFLRLEGSPFHVVAQTRAWPWDAETSKGPVRRAGVSSFGFGGTNAHVILESYPVSAAPAAFSGPLPFLLAAPSQWALQAYAASLARFIENEAVLDLSSLAATLAFGREHFQHRLAVVAHDASSLAAALLAASQGKQALAPASDVSLQQLADTWVAGGSVDWQASLPSNLSRLGGVVSFPFERVNHWFSVGPAPAQQGSPVSAQVAAEALKLTRKSDVERVVRSKGKIALSSLATQSPPAFTTEAEPAFPIADNATAPVSSSTAVPASGGMEQIAQFLRETLSELLDIPQTHIAGSEPFADLGLDSIFGIQLIRRLNQYLGREIQAAQVYEYPTVDALAGYCAHQVVAAAIVDTPVLLPEVKPVQQATVEQWLSSLVARVLARSVVADQAFSQWMSSFDMLRVISALEAEYGPLKKSLLFDVATLPELADFLGERQAPRTVQGAPEQSSPRVRPLPETAIADNQALFVKKLSLAQWPALQQVVAQLHHAHGKEGGLPGRDIAPYVFIGKRRLGYFNCSQAGDVLFSFSYVGTEQYLPELAQEYIEMARAQGMKANFLSLVRLQQAGPVTVTATPFGVVQRLENFADFSLSGSRMRKLRYLVNRFESSGQCRTAEYRVGSDNQVDMQIVEVIDQWAATKQMVNPYVATVRAEIAAGTLDARHRMFLTTVDNVLANAIIVTHIPSENGYLLDLEFYGAQAPAGGLEFAISRIFETLIAEGDTFFSFGGTFGVKVCDSDNTDDVAEAALQELRALGLVNNDGNVQFKNKFAPSNLPVYLCRADEPDSTPVADILLMIASPQPQDSPASEVVSTVVEQPELQTLPDTEQGRREVQLRAVGYNPVRLAPGDVEFDLMTDSWSELEAPFIAGRMAELRSKLLGAGVDYSLEQQTLLPFTYVRAAASGRAAEAMLCRALPRRGRTVLSNALFPSWAFNLMDQGLSEEIVAARCSDDQETLFAGDFDLVDLQARLRDCADNCAFVAVELSNNARGGRAVSLANLRAVSTLAHEYGVLLVMDATRLLENALCVIQAEEGFAEQDLWEVAGEILAQADAVSMGMSKDFGCSYGGLVATSDAQIAAHIDERTALRGHELNRENRALLARALEDRSKVGKLVSQRMQGVAQLWRRLREAGVPVRGELPGTHCVLLDVAAWPVLRDCANPVESCLAWIYRETGIRAARHLASSGEQAFGQCIRLAVPVGLNFKLVCQLADRLVTLFQSDIEVPVLELEDPKASRSEQRFHVLASVQRASQPGRKMLERATNAALRAPDENYRVIQDTLPDVQRHLVEADDGEVEVVMAGQGPVLLLMHPFNIGAGLFAQQFKGLSAHYRVVSIHHPGVGATNAQARLSLDGVADLFVQVLEKLQITGPMHIAGASAGGLQAQAFVHRYPYLSATLTLICSSYKVGNRDGKVSPLYEVIDEDMALIARHVDDPQLMLERQQLSQTLLRCESMDPRIGLKYLDEFTNLPDLRAMLADLDVPSLIIQGRHDSVIAEQTTQTLLSGIAGAQLKMIESGGHFVTLTDAEECNDALLAFLADHPIRQVKPLQPALDDNLAIAK